MQYQLIHELVTQQAHNHPDYVALISGHQKITYYELNSRANRLARFLLAQGVKKDEFVGIHFTSADRFVSMMAILKIGAVFVPLDTKRPPDNLLFIINDANINIILSDKTLNLDLSQSDSKFINIAEINEKLEKLSSEELNIKVESDSLAYVIYTSGTTGVPKGVLIEHRNLLNLVHWHISTFNISFKERASILAGPGFDASIWESFPYLAVGATLLLPDDPDICHYPIKLHDWLIDQSITMSFIPTAVAERILLLDWPEETSLEILFTGGDFLHIHPGKNIPFKLINAYGLTETTVVATYYEVPYKSAISLTPYIGKPIDNVSVYILDESEQPVEPGISGELYITGASVARGYLNKPEITSKRFLKLPHINNKEIFYKTGDLASFSEDGFLIYHGRNDDQVQIRGHRIELTSIETKLLEHPNIQKAAVIAYAREKSHRKSLISFYETNDLSHIKSELLHEFLARKFPNYMLPAAYIPLERLPLTENGKIDRKYLEKLYEASFLDTALPTTEMEFLISNVYEDILNIKNPSINKTFAEYGGSSLEMGILIPHLNELKLVNQPIAIDDLYKNNTIRKLAEHFVKLEKSHEKN